VRCASASSTPINATRTYLPIRATTIHTERRDRTASFWLSPLRTDRGDRVPTVPALVGSQAAISGTAFSGGGCSGGV
jgi:hypothetical protein